MDHLNKESAQPPRPKSSTRRHLPGEASTILWESRVRHSFSTKDFVLMNFPLQSFNEAKPHDSPVEARSPQHPSTRTEASTRRSNGYKHFEWTKSKVNLCNQFGISVHKVGDSDGWTTIAIAIANVDYKIWATSKSFQLGDIIVFEYNPQFHNVMRVTHVEYKACNASSPISTHTTGNDSITIDTPGHHLFICGIPGHCQAGQKVDINVPRAPSRVPPTTVSAAPAPAVTATEAPAPSNGVGVGSPLNMHFHHLLLLQLACIVFGLS